MNETVTAERRTARSRHLLAGTLAGFTLAAGFALSATEEASAYPTHCVMTTYYKEAALQNEVGVRTTCPGGSPWGRTSPYKEREVIELQPPGPGGPPGPGNMPCEFTPKGCSPIPGPRH